VVRVWTETADVRKEKLESRAEVKRLQALKENDMEAYAKLVQETKNDRLHFLLNQTDTYLATINRMVQNQRDEADLEDADEKAGITREMKEIKQLKEEKVVVKEVPNGQASVSAPSSSSTPGALKNGAVSAASTSGTETMTKGSKDYYENTHKRNERVSQPQMLRGGDLKEYQLGGLQWMVSLYNNNLNGILADEMGLGKTIQAIALLAYVMEFKHNNGPFLIVVPLSTLSNWVNELSKWAPDMMKVVYKGTPPVRKQMYRDEVEGGQFNVLLTTYEYIMKDKAQLKKFHWQYIIVDEGHRMKNAQSKFAQTLGSVYQSRHRVLLTGTPLQNNLPELWALLNFLLPTIFSSVDTFDQWFNKPFAAFRNQPNTASGSGTSEEAEGEVASLSQEEQLLIVHRLHEVLRPFVLRRVKDQVLDQLPEKTERVLRCDLSGWQRKLYKAIHTKSIASRDKNGEDCSAGGLNNAVMQLRKVCNHPYLFLNDYYVDEDMVRSSGKFELLDRMLPKLKAAGHRVLMFSQMTQVMTILEAFFAMRGLSCLRLDGSTTSDEREKRMFMFNDPDSPYFIFLLSTRAGGLGLNLATADTVVLFDSDWNPMMDAQAQDRAHRIGQKNEVRVFRLVTTSLVEERILARATDKRNLNGLVVEAGKFNNKAAGVNDEAESNKAMVESLLKEWSAGGGAPEGGTAEGVEDGEVEEEPEAEVPDDDQINEMMSTHDSELLIYQQMDRERRILKEKQWADWMKKQPKGTPKTPMPPALMGALEKPLWLQASSWSHKHSQLDSIMMGDGDGTFIPQKKGSKKKRKADGLDDDDDDDDDDDEEDEDGVLVAGKLMRRRKEGVSYDDHMTDKQFLRHVEKVQDQEDAAEVKEKMEKKPVAAAQKVRKVEMSADLVEAITKVQ
jgi:SNF2 family DNA or RNA helicase